MTATMTRRPKSPETVKAEHDAATPPNGCSICGVLEREHCIRYDGRHSLSGGRYIPPTNAQRLDRMYAARAVRLHGSVFSAAYRLVLRTLPLCTTCNVAPGTNIGECRSCFSFGLDLEKGYRRDPRAVVAPPTEPVFAEDLGDGLVVVHALIDTLDTTVCAITDVKVAVDPVAAGALRCSICFVPKGGRS